MRNGRPVSKLSLFILMCTIFILSIQFGETRMSFKSRTDHNNLLLVLMHIYTSTTSECTLTEVTLYLQRSGCTYKGQVVLTEVRLYLQGSGCTYRGQAVLTEVRLYLQRSGCTYRGHAVLTEARLYLQRSGCTYRGQAVLTEVRL